MPTIGAQVIPARLADLRRLLGQLSAADLGALDESLGGWLARPLGREALAAAVLPTAGSTYICMFNLEPAGLMVIERGQLAGRVRALAVAPDLRRRGLARTMLEAADRLAAQAGLRWLWMSVPSANLPATRCALACGYRRYRPQFMRRQRPQALPLRAEDARAIPLEPAEAADALAHWLALAAQQGDPWCKSLAQADLRSWNVAPLREGRFYRLADPAGQAFGLAHLREGLAQATVTLWLDQAIWGAPRELQALKAVLDAPAALPATLDVEFGSSGHLRAAAQAYKALGFCPVLRERVVMVRRVGAHNRRSTT
jgi:ribosomal protein S18 acetylase RimI-like enzyme